jgi:hypothetical protein
MHAYVANLWGTRRLILSPDGNLILDGDAVSLESTKPTASLSIYPRTRQMMGPTGTPLGAESDGVFVRYNATTGSRTVAVDVKQTRAATTAPTVKMGSRRKPLPPDDAEYENSAATWQVTVPHDALDGVADVRLQIHFIGDTARVYIGDQLVDDHFYFGPAWEIGLKRFGADALGKGLTIKATPLRKDLAVYLSEDHRPAFDEDGKALELRAIDAIPVYEMRLTAAR